MSTVLSFLFGGLTTVGLFSLPPAALTALVGIAAGVLLALAVLFAYALARTPARPQPRRRSERRSRRIVTSVQYAGGVA